MIKPYENMKTIENHIKHIKHIKQPQYKETKTYENPMKTYYENPMNPTVIYGSRVSQRSPFHSSLRDDRPEGVLGFDSFFYSQ